MKGFGVVDERLLGVGAGGGFEDELDLLGLGFDGFGD